MFEGASDYTFIHLQGTQCLVIVQDNYQASFITFETGAKGPGVFSCIGLDKISKWLLLQKMGYV